MRRVLLGLAVVGLLAAPALAEITGTAVKMPGTIGAVTVNGMSESVEYIPGEGPPIAGFGTHVFDNIPTFWGGAGTGSYAGSRWVGSAAYWGDDLHGLPVSAIVTHLTVGYAATLTGPRTISFNFHNTIGAGAHPGATTGIQTFAASTGGAAVFSFPATGWYLLNVTLATPIHLPAAGAWMGWAAAGNSGWWLSGGTPGIGWSHSGVLYDSMGWPGSGYWVPGNLGAFSSIPGNVGQALGFIPEPTTIMALALGGLLALRRRKA